MATGYFEDTKCCKIVHVKEGQVGLPSLGKKDFEEIEGTVRNSKEGHQTIKVYKWKGHKFIIGGIYGFSVN
jgi:hypothetical protein